MDRPLSIRLGLTLDFGSLPVPDTWVYRRENHREQLRWAFDQLNKVQDQNQLILMSHFDQHDW